MQKWSEIKLKGGIYDNILFKTNCKEKMINNCIIICKNNSNKTINFHGQINFNDYEEIIAQNDHKSISFFDKILQRKTTTNNKVTRVQMNEGTSVHLFKDFF